MKKYLLIVLLLVEIFVLTPFFTYAQTQTINQLLEQIAALRQQLAILQGGQNPTGAWCHTFNTNLSIGMIGSEVMALQTALTKAGFSINSSGNFNEATASAVSSFQLKYKSEILIANGLAYPTGYFGPATRRKINSLYACNNPVVVVPPVSSPLSPTSPPPVFSISLPVSPDQPGYKKSSIGRFINTDIVVDTDSVNVSDTELNEFLRIANNILVIRTDTEIKLGKIRRISYYALQTLVCPGCLAGTGDTLSIFPEVYKNVLEPEFIIFLHADNVSSTHGGYTSAFESQNNSYHNHFKSSGDRSNSIYISIQDWNHKFGRCGYDYSDPKNPKHISNISIGGECRNRPGTACTLKDSYYQCNDNEMLNSFYGRNSYAFNASTAIHELMHQFGSDGVYDHYGTTKCAVTGYSSFLNDAQEFAGICPTTFENFKNSYQ